MTINACKPEAQQVKCLIPDPNIIFSIIYHLFQQIRVERPQKRDQRPEEFDIMVPVLDVVMGAFAPHKLKPVSWSIICVYSVNILSVKPS